tara:strand:- start:785 stop:985 length:201 start_codon:yes stop_codon:yes gene_type:complete
MFKEKLYNYRVVVQGQIPGEGQISKVINVYHVNEGYAKYDACQKWIDLTGGDFDYEVKKIVCLGEY